MQNLILTNNVVSFLARSLDASGQSWAMLSAIKPNTWMNWIWWALVLIVLAAGVVILVCIGYKHRKTKQLWEKFDQRGSQAGLRNAELKVLRFMARTVGLKNPTVIFTVDSAFELGFDALMTSGKVATMSAHERTSLNGMLESIRQKLGFHLSVGTFEAEPMTTTRQIPLGAELLVPAHPSGDEFEATLTAMNADEFVIEAYALTEAVPGDLWTLRYSRDSLAWEFEAKVIRGEAGKAVLAHSHDIRPTNYRRFYRAPVDKPMRIARLAFHGGAEGIEFVDATLVEIGGPGILFKSSIAIAVDERILVSIELSDGLPIQAMAKVRRSLADESGVSMVAAELVALESDEIAELCRQTMLADLSKARVNEEARELALQGAAGEAL